MHRAAAIAFIVAVATATETQTITSKTTKTMTITQCAQGYTDCPLPQSIAAATGNITFSVAPTGTPPVQVSSASPLSGPLGGFDGHQTRMGIVVSIAAAAAVALVHC
ncbi:hypothetical protein AAL_07251 [Moelleriella libera RCEF 2490]|uniref:Uncharacterized protein n=1 Tax=Moelleriella libera RCEF 2490 TaxID=1081109 RepID=A0A167XWN7_9HYPO|nr:hypothetical protein AAL_07251 [Moelleriella libera RCEF 2490]